MPKILAIDDKQDNLISISALLKNLIPGCIVITAQSGIEGVEKAKSEMPDVILLDIIMPKMDGYETCGHLKSDETTKYIPIIMLTAIKTDQQSRIKGLEIGADAFLSKPIDEAELIAQVRVALRIKDAEDKLRNERDFLEMVVEERSEALRKSEERYRLIFRHSPVGIYYYNTNLVIVDCNDRFAEILQSERKKLIGLDMKTLKDHSVLNAISAPLKGKESYYEGPYTATTSNACIWITMRTDVLYKNHGDIVGCVGIVEDITERKMAKEEKRRLQSQLRQAQKLEAVGTLAGGIAHDFNNLLFVIMGNTELVIDDLPADNIARKSMEEVLTAANRAKDLVKQILNFSRQNMEERNPLQIQSILKEALKLTRSSLPATIEMRQSIDNECGTILADPTEIYQVVMNLCTNAYHAMRDKGGILTVELTEIRLKPDNHVNLNPGLYLHLMVGDTGHGMDKTVMKRIFDPFYTTKAVGEGTGMGLAVVYGIVKSYGGDIRVHSQVGQGTAFSIYLPRIEEAIKYQNTASVDTPPKGK